MFEQTPRDISLRDTIRVRFATRPFSKSSSNAPRACSAAIPDVVPKRARYAIKALTNLSFSEFVPKTSGAIALEEGLPTKYLEIILAQLRAAGLLRSVRGVSGGFSLARPADKIRIADILLAVGAPLSPLPCLETDAPCEGCADVRTCLLRRMFEPGYRMWMEQIASSTLCELADLEA